MTPEKAVKATKETKAEKKAVEKPTEPEMVPLKDVAAKAGISPREARSILRKINARGEDAKRSRWQFAPGEVAGVVAKIKASIDEKAKAKEAKEKEEAAEENEGEDEE